METELTYNQVASLNLSGEVTYDTLPTILLQWEKMKPSLKMNLKSQPALHVSCAQLSQADSSCIAFLLELRRFAYSENKEWILIDTPAFLSGFFTTYGVTQVLQNTSIE